jgi:hypothetical protein
MKEKLPQPDPRLVLAVGLVAMVGMSTVGVPRLDAITVVALGAVAAVEPTLAETFAYLLSDALPGMAPLGLDPIVSTADAVGQRYGVAAGVGASAVVASLVEVGSRLR